MTAKSTPKVSAVLPEPQEPVVDDVLRTVFNLIEAGRLRRAKSLLAKAAGWTEVEWNGCTFKLFPANNLSDRHFWLKGTPDETTSILKLVSLVEGKKVTFWDIGANCGVYSVVIARKAAKGSRIFAFEPNPEMFARLNRNLTANKLGKAVTARNVALGAHEGDSELFIFDNNLGRATLRTNDDKAQDRKITVPVETLVQYVEKSLPGSVKILKIDVEGFEDRVLMPWVSRCEDLGEIDYLLIEHTQRKEWGDDILDALVAKGYKPVFTADGNTLMAGPRALADATSG